MLIFPSLITGRTVTLCLTGKIIQVALSLLFTSQNGSAMLHLLSPAKLQSV